MALDFGLITPIIFKAQTKGLVEISNEVKTLAGLAKEKKLKPNQYEGGGFSVSNLGMYGIKNFTSIINPPQSCIIAVGAGEERPVVMNGKIEIATVMTVTMSADHRVVDGGTGAKFLQTLKQFIEEPASMLLMSLNSPVSALSIRSCPAAGIRRPTGSECALWLILI